MAASSPQWNPSLDALIAAPNHHWVLLENDDVRVLEVRIPPGETVPLHTHRWPSVLHLITWADIVRRNERGEVMFDCRDLEPQMKKTGVNWCAPYPPHTVENVDSVELYAIAIELKR